MSNVIIFKKRKIKKKMMQQVDTYVHWINSQLEKRPNSRHVSSLSKDMKDGVIFLQLVEVISQEKQDIVDQTSLSTTDMKRNITYVLEFLSRNNVRIHHIVPKEILEGNLKATMRLVLALAAHFKPESFKYHRIQSTPESERKRHELQKAASLMSLASDASASLVEASKNASNSGMSLHYKHRNRSRISNQTSTPIRPHSSEPSVSQTVPSRRSKTMRMENFEIPDISHSPNSLRSRRAKSESSNQTRASAQRSSSINSQESIPNAKRNLIPSDSFYDFNERDEVLQRHDVMLEEFGTTKDILQELQEILLCGCTPEEKLGMESRKDDSFQEQLVMKNIILEQKVEECDELRSHINELKEINMTWSGEKTALEMRVSQQEQLILSLKSKLLQYEISKKNPNEMELEELLNERDKELHLLHDELTKRDNIIHKQKDEIDSMSNNIVTKKRTEANLHAKLESSESMVSSLKMQVQELTERMHSCSLAENNHVDDITNKLNEAKFLKEKQKISREHSNMKMTLSNIKRHFKPDHPVQHAFESMEHSMTSLIDAMSMMENNIHAKENKQVIPRAYPVNIKTPPSSDSGYDHNGNMSLEGGEQVKIVYFLGKSITPVLKTTDIGLGFFTLRDFKHVVKRPGNYRYFFKAVDKDFGFVREELLFDEDIVPGHENKIVAWLEKQFGEEV